MVLELRMNDEEQASFDKDRAHLPKKLTGAQAWYGPDILSSTAWIYSLSDQDINEINIGHAIIAQAVFTGLKDAIKKIISIINKHD